jgi:hypothetical protein
MKLLKLCLAISGTTVLLGALVSNAFARNLSISNQNISAMWREIIAGNSGGEINCEATLEGSMHARTAAKVVGSLVGYITSAILGPCRTGTGTILRETLPWHVRYSGFTGTLPTFTSLTIHVVGGSFRVREPGGVTCHFRSTTAEPDIGIFHRNTVTQELTEIGLGGTIRSGAECFGLEGRLSSVSGAVSLQGRPEVRISVSLI